MSKKCTLPVEKIIEMARTKEGMAKLKNDHGIKGRLTLERLQEANPGVSFLGKSAARAAEAEIQKGKTSGKAKGNAKAKASGKTSGKPASSRKGKAKAAPKAAVPAGYRMLLKAVEGETNLSDTLLVGAYKDVEKLLRDADVPVTSVKGVYLMDDDTIAAHVYIRGKDGAQEMDNADFAIEIAEALDADSAELYEGALLAEGSKAKNFVAYDIQAIDADGYDTLSVEEIQ